MKRLLLLVITSLMILTACGNGNDKNSQSNNKQQEQNSNNVKTVATDQEVQGDNYRTILPLKKAKLVEYYKIIWLIAITVKISKMVYYI